MTPSWAPAKRLVQAIGLFGLVALSGCDRFRIESLPERSHVTFVESDEDFLNPERGFYDWIELLGENATSPEEMRSIRQGGSTLAFAFVRLNAFPDRAISEEYLVALDEALSRVRESGLKLIVRVAYRFPELETASQEPTLARIEEHTKQLRAVFLRNADIIAVTQAGMIGPWGEWHSSTEQLSTAAAQKAVLDNVLAMVPESRMVQVRVPSRIMEFYPQSSATAADTPSPDRDRVGHHNDCFLANDTDGGTFSPGIRGTRERQYTEMLARRAMIGGETCQLEPEKHRTSCLETLSELERFHYTFLNKGFYEPDIARWKAEGCYDEISQRLGYRFVLIEASADVTRRAGQMLHASITVQNNGFARLLNSRSALLILRDANGTDTVLDIQGEGAQLTSADCPTGRTPKDQGLVCVMPDAGETQTIDMQIPLPSDIAAGIYEILLSFPDEAPSLRDRPDYALRLANLDTWEPSTGYNRLGLLLTVK